jgi:hypothetical protein
MTTAMHQLGAVSKTPAVALDVSILGNHQR